MIEVRRIRDADDAANALTDLYRREPAPRRLLSSTLADDRFVLIVAYIDSRPVGYVQGHLLDRLDGARKLLIYDIEVAPEHQRRGVGRALMEHTLDQGRDSGATHCWLITEPGNDPSIGLYRSMGGEVFPTMGYLWRLIDST